MFQDFIPREQLVKVFLALKLLPAGSLSSVGFVRKECHVGQRMSASASLVQEYCSLGGEALASGFWLGSQGAGESLFTTLLIFPPLLPPSLQKGSFIKQHTTCLGPSCQSISFVIFVTVVIGISYKNKTTA